MESMGFYETLDFDQIFFRLLDTSDLVVAEKFPI
jgi:hypothetical protein